MNKWLSLVTKALEEHNKSKALAKLTYIGSAPGCHGTGVIGTDSLWTANLHQCIAVKIEGETCNKEALYQLHHLDFSNQDHHSKCMAIFEEQLRRIREENGKCTARIARCYVPSTLPTVKNFQDYNISLTREILSKFDTKCVEIGYIEGRMLVGGSAVVSKIGNLQSANPKKLVKLEELQKNEQTRLR